jgi:hypothetical protein
MTFFDDYDDFSNSGGLHKEDVNIPSDRDRILDRRPTPKIRMTKCTSREFLSFLVGGLSSTTDLCDSSRSKILRSVAKNIGLSQEEASALLRSLNMQSELYHEQAKSGRFDSQYD